MSRNTPAHAVLPLVLISLALGCGGASSGPRYTDRQSGVTMTLPKGWVQRGNMCFEDPQWETPRGMVFVMPMEGENLKSHVEKVLKNQVTLSDAFKGLVKVAGDVAGGDAAKEAAKEAADSLDTTFTPPKAVRIGGVDAFESVLTTPDVTTIYAYVLKDSSVVEIMFQAETGKWSQYETAFRASIQSITLAD